MATPEFDEPLRPDLSRQAWGELPAGEEAGFLVDGDGRRYRFAPNGKRVYLDKKQGGIKRILGPVGAGIIFVLTKLKLVLALLVKGKMLGTLITMVIAVGTYTLFWGWPFALGFVCLIFCHEMGHVLALRRQGVKATAPIFIPFFGAAIAMREMPHNVWNEAKMAIAGPVAGSLASALVWVAGMELHANLLVALAYTGFLLNLFNLLPTSPLDGGRITAALHPALWFVGIGLLAAGIYFLHSALLAIFLVIGIFEVRTRWRQFRRKERGDYYKVSRGRRFAVGVAYFGLAALLAAAMIETKIDTHTLHHAQQVSAPAMHTVGR